LFSLFMLKSGAAMANAIMPAAMVTSIRRQGRPLSLGDLRRVEPVSRAFGFKRGTPIDRYYIERFLADHRSDVAGRVLEFGDNTYTKAYGADRVTASDIMHVREGEPVATIVGDLADAPHIPDSSFDCVICTQTLMFIYDSEAAVRTLHRILKPGGVVLCTVAGISQICRWDMDQWGDYWRFTDLSIRRIFESAFQPDAITVQNHGNVLTASAFLHGMALEDLTVQEIEHQDRDYQMLLTVRAAKPAAV
jgi:SAM-dependent methyltransferase